MKRGCISCSWTCLVTHTFTHVRPSSSQHTTFLHTHTLSKHLQDSRIIGVFLVNMSRGGLWTEEQFNCPVCLDLPSEPVTIPCGHSYCMDCIADYWDSEQQKKGTCSCPECRQHFQPRPPLCRNTMLAEAVEQLRLGNLSTASRESIRNARRAAASASQRGPQKKKASLVTCDRCQDVTEAAKTCLVCMASFCQKHVKSHQTQEKFKSHELMEPVADLSRKICPQHKYLHEFYCRTCQSYICWLCTSNKHKDHESVSTQAERNEKQVWDLLHLYFIINGDWDRKPVALYWTLTVPDAVFSSLIM